MSALRKPSVAAMIMVVCIIIALLIGRAGGVSSTGSSDSGWAETVNEVVNRYTTVGAIQEAVSDAQNTREMIQTGELVEDESVTNKRMAVSTIIIVLGVILVIRGIAGKK
ncbi:MAG: hypothetical protein K6A74_00050 [Lachnospiraceae bacterium]|nr:hypothetical protein [Lachnospiraceae bacterium]